MRITIVHSFPDSRFPFPVPGSRFLVPGFSNDCRMRFLERVLFASCKKRSQLLSFNIAYTYEEF